MTSRATGPRASLSGKARAGGAPGVSQEASLHVCPDMLALPPRACRTLAMVKPDAFKNLGKIINAIQASGFVIK